jgi:hypothetical protein
VSSSTTLAVKIIMLLSYSALPEHGTIMGDSALSIGMLCNGCHATTHTVHARYSLKKTDAIYQELVMYYRNSGRLIYTTNQQRKLP